jgi:hypothetical protein
MHQADRKGLCSRHVISAACRRTQTRERQRTTPVRPVRKSLLSFESARTRRTLPVSSCLDTRLRSVCPCDVAAAPGKRAGAGLHLCRLRCALERGSSSKRLCRGLQEGSVASPKPPLASAALQAAAHIQIWLGVACLHPMPVAADDASSAYMTSKLSREYERQQSGQGCPCSGSSLPALAAACCCRAQFKTAMYRLLQHRGLSLFARVRKLHEAH